jgi:hypothetical protein
LLGYDRFGDLHHSFSKSSNVFQYIRFSSEENLTCAVASQSEVITEVRALMMLIMSELQESAFSVVTLELNSIGRFGGYFCATINRS